MKELLEIIAKSLVEHPEDVRVNENKAETGTTLTLFVNDSDMGKVIGKQGRIAKSIRLLVKAAAIHNHVRVNVEIGER